MENLNPYFLIVYSWVDYLRSSWSCTDLCNRRILFALKYVRHLSRVGKLKFNKLSWPFWKYSPLSVYTTFFSYLVLPNILKKNICLFMSLFKIHILSKPLKKMIISHILDSFSNQEWAEFFVRIHVAGNFIHPPRAVRLKESGEARTPHLISKMRMTTKTAAQKTTTTRTTTNKNNGTKNNDKKLYPTTLCCPIAHMPHLISKMRMRTKTMTAAQKTMTTRTTTTKTKTTKQRQKIYPPAAAD